MTIHGWQRVVLITTVSIFILDQGSKYLVTQHGSPIVINQGISFGWLGEGKWLTLGLVVLICLGIGGTYRYWQRAPLAVGLFLGGVMANMSDRFIFGGVRDWLPIPLLGLYNNLADWAILLAVFLLIGQYMYARPTHDHSTAETSESTP